MASQTIDIPFVLPSTIPLIEVDVPLAPGTPPVPVQIPANSPEEAFAILLSMGDAMEAGMAGAGARNIYYGSVLEPIRDSYKLRLEMVERSIQQRRLALGATPDPLELRGLAQWAARQRAKTARISRLPTPALLAGLEARDWREYGPGGRTFENLMRRKQARFGLTGPAAYESILSSASTSNPEVNAKIARAAQHLRRGGAILGVVGLGFTAAEIAEAAPEDRGHVAGRAAVSFAGGLVGSEVAVGLVTVGAALLLGVTPAGWVVLAVGLVGGIAGGVIADRVFFPPETENTARTLSSGVAVDPQRLAVGGGVPGAGTGGSAATTTLPVIRQVSVPVRAGDTQFTLGQRAYTLAAASVGLSADQQVEFADRHASPAGIRWVSGDPTPQGSRSMNEEDIALTAGREIIFRLNEAQRTELLETVGAR